VTDNVSDSEHLATSVLEHTPTSGTICRFCGGAADHVFVDLGMSPLCESLITAGQLNGMEAFYPLRVTVCERCFLVQLPEFVSPEAIFGEYAYFSSYSRSWVEHARVYTERVAGRFGLGASSLAVELASNDGYLLQHFVSAGIPVLGIEPAANVAKAAEAKNVPTRVCFFGTDTARELVEEGRQADLLIGNNVLAQVPQLNDFVAGMKIALKPRGVITMEFPHLQRLMEGNQFDTIYHEHFSYFSFMTVEQIFKAHGLTLFDVEEIPTHGGSLRIYARHTEDTSRSIEPAVQELLSREQRAGLDRLETYGVFEERVKETKRKLLDFLIGIKRANKSIAGYGAPGKGNTLLNYCGIRSDFLDTHLSSRTPSRNEARLHLDSSLEPEGRNHGTALVCA
jgi:2-polyprenyl-3-methyl-5-hydroxy-6-metoxy-1,4-benzoquinol methylase